MTISRRDFLKFSSVLAASSLFQPSLQLLPNHLSVDPEAKNILIIVFDALTAQNIYLYGYPRETMPHLTRLLDRATVYHNHYASGNFTTPGTASLLTGRHPWEHLALQLTDTVKPEIAPQNIFSFFDDYFRLAYTHNPYADILLTQFNDSISQHADFQSLYLGFGHVNPNQWFMDLMDDDLDTAVLFKSRLNNMNLDGLLYKLMFPNLLGQDDYIPPEKISALFPLGLPEADFGYFTLEQSIDWILKQRPTQPFLEYFHLLPPHSPYRTRGDFADFFLGDGFEQPEKDMHPVIIPANIIPLKTQVKQRREYDEFLLYVDSEFNRLINGLEQQGVLDNTLIVFTSDHGELFERWSIGHAESFLFDPAVKVPLIIFEPGQKQRRDIHTLTSCIDILPTLLHYSGKDIPPYLPGTILPPFGEQSPQNSRTIFALDSRLNLDNTHIPLATLMMRRGSYKVIRYCGYPEFYRLNWPTKLEFLGVDSDVYFEIFNLDDDPEELINLALRPSQEMEALILELEQLYREKVEFT